MTGLIEFFFNLIPGSLLIAAVTLLNKDIISRNVSASPSASPVFEKLLSPAFLIFIVTGLSLFIGFMLQGVSKFLLRDHLLKANDFLASKTATDPETKPYYLAALKIFKDKNIPCKDKNYKGNIYIMHNYLWGSNQATGPSYFLARAALWSNVGTGALVIILISLCKARMDIAFYSLLMLLLSSAFYYYNQKSFFDVILKTFVAMSLIDNKNNGV